MKLSIYLEITFRILIIGLIGLLMTFVPENLPEFFGDVFHDSCTREYCRHGFFGADAKGKYVWGSRHYWYFWTLFFTFMWTLISFFIRVFSLINTEFGDK